jgi:hypothetical protein
MRPALLTAYQGKRCNGLFTVIGSSDMRPTLLTAYQGKRCYSLFAVIGNSVMRPTYLTAQQFQVNDGTEPVLSYW